MKQKLTARGPTFYRTGTDSLTIPAGTLKPGVVVTLTATFTRTSKERLKAKRQKRQKR